MIYFFGWAAVYYALLVSAMVGYKGRALGILAIFIFAGIAVFRGSTGTDTVNYELILSEFSLSSIWEGVEPGFTLLGLFFVELSGSAETGVRIVSALFFLLVTFYYLRSDGNEAFLLLAYMAPAYFYSYSMNALRIGVASIMLLIAVQELRRDHAIKSGFVMMVAVTFHYSILFSIGCFVIGSFKRVKLRSIFFSGLFALLFFCLTYEYICRK